MIPGNIVHIAVAVMTALTAIVISDPKSNLLAGIRAEIDLEIGPRQITPVILGVGRDSAGRAPGSRQAIWYDLTEVVCPIVNQRSDCGAAQNNIRLDVSILGLTNFIVMIFHDRGEPEGKASITVRWNRVRLFDPGPVHVICITARRIKLGRAIAPMNPGQHIIGEGSPTDCRGGRGRRPTSYVRTCIGRSRPSVKITGLEVPIHPGEGRRNS